MPRRLLSCLLLAAALTGASASVASAGEPPNQNDPCSKAGRDSCGTTGVGQYKTYKYGIRWFGDYRGAIPGVSGSSFCIDLRYWYPSSKFGYVKREITTLKNRDGDTVSAATLRRMNYAMWTYGRSTDKTKQAAVMLYVHNGMGDGAPGEVASNAIGSAVKNVYDDISADAAKYAGPYKVTASVPDGLKVGQSSSVTVQVKSASGALVPGVAVTLSSKGADGLPTKVNTGKSGTSKISFRPTSAKSGVAVSAQTEDLPAAEPNLYVPTKTDAVSSGQRLVTPNGDSVSTKASADAKVVAPTLTTTATPTAILGGEATHDEVTMSSTPDGFKARVLAKLYGPAPTQAALTCTGQPVAQQAFTASTGKTSTPDFKPTAPGWYTYQLVIDDTESVKGVTTPCAVPEESLRVQVQPAVHTQVSSTTLKPGDSLTDSVVVSGLSGQSTQVQVQLFGPTAADAVKCDAAPIATQTFTANGDGTYVTDPVPLSTPGYYTYKETLPDTDLVRTVDTPCADTNETSIVRGAPTIKTQISSATTKPGDMLSDMAVVSGLGALHAPVSVELWGPYATPDAIDCTGTPAATQMLTANGDGTYMTDPVALPAAGYYTYREAIIATGDFDGVQTMCAEGPETTITKATPVVTTVVSEALTRPGATITDKVNVTGTGKTPLDVEVRLYGPFSSRAAISCSGTPLAKSVLKATGDGTFTSEGTKLTRAGFYTFRERVADAPIVTGTETACGDTAETSFAIAAIPTGRGDVRRATAAAAPVATSSGPTPARVQLKRLGVSAPITSVGIDTTKNELDIPVNIGKVGYWKDGAALGDKAGSLLLAGHVDSAAKGAGAFYPLKSARKGDVVTVTSVAGKVSKFKVTSVTKVLKAALPVSVYATTGKFHLTLVTCGGPFDQAAGHYRDNIIVTASPVT